MECKKCGSFVKKSYKFCSVCGEKVLENKSQNSTHLNSNLTINQTVKKDNNSKKGNQVKKNNVNNKKKISNGIILGFAFIYISIPIIIFFYLISNFFYSIPGDYKGYSGVNIFDGDGYYVRYNNNWKKGTYSEKDVLTYIFDDNSYLMPIGKSDLSDYTCDFHDYDCYKTIYNDIYNDFFDLWSEEVKEKSLTLYETYGSHFSNLDNGISYAVYNYGKSESELFGQYYLIVSQKYNVILSFVTKTDISAIFPLLKDDTLSLLKTIVIDSVEESLGKIIYDYDFDNMIDSMSNWDEYSSLRTGNLGKYMGLNGGWRILGDSESYWEFKEYTFSWYKSVNDLNDNYWQGMTKVWSGKLGFEAVGLDENKIEDIISRSNGRISSYDIYTIICTPTKIIENGVDKSATNITDNAKWVYVWILINHGNEGIEAQVLNLDTGEISSYVKIKG